MAFEFREPELAHEGHSSSNIDAGVFGARRLFRFGGNKDGHIRASIANCLDVLCTVYALILANYGHVYRRVARYCKNI